MTETYRVHSKGGVDYGWHRLTLEKARVLRRCGCRVTATPDHDMNGKDWLPGPPHRKAEAEE